MLKKITYTEKENGRAVSFYEISFQENEQIFCAYKLKQDARISALTFLPSYAERWKKRFLSIRTSALKWSKEEKDSSFLSILDGEHMHMAYEKDQNHSPEWQALVSLMKETAMLQPAWLFDPRLPMKDPSWQEEKHKAYIDRFNRWYEALSSDSQTEVQKMYPEPASWKGYWSREDQTDILWIGNDPVCFLVKDGTCRVSTEGSLSFHFLAYDHKLLYFNAVEIERKLAVEKERFLSSLKEDKYTEELLATRYGLSVIDDEILWKRTRLVLLIQLLFPLFLSDSGNREILLSTGNKKLLYACTYDSLLSESGENLLGKALMMIREELDHVYSFRHAILMPQKPSSHPKDSKQSEEMIQHAWELADQAGMEENALEHVHEALVNDPENSDGWLLAASLSSQLSMSMHGYPSMECGRDLGNALVYGKYKTDLYQSAAETLLAWITETMLSAFDTQQNFQEEAFHTFLYPLNCVSEITGEINAVAAIYGQKISLNHEKIYQSAIHQLNRWITALKNKGLTEQEAVEIRKTAELHMQ